MSKIITLDRVRTVLKEVVEERPEHVQPICAYLSASRLDERNPHLVVSHVPWLDKAKRYEVICVAAQVFHRIDPDINVELKADFGGAIGTENILGPDGQLSISAEVLANWGFTAEAINYLGEAQFWADSLLSWATAYERAEESL